MNNKAAERIRALKEKGTITQEQADELLGVISEEERNEEENPVRGGPGPGPEAADSDRYSRHGGRRHSRSFLDMDWVGDMVDGITSGLGVAPDRDHPAGDWGRSSDDYRYEWDPRWGRRRGGNAENSSRVEQPEGESFEFQENRVIFSKLSGMRLVRAKVRDNAFSASTFRGAALTDSAIVDSSLAGASVHDLLMDSSEMKDVVIAGSKIHRLELRGGSGLKNVKLSGSSVSGFNLESASQIEDTRFAGVAINGCTFSEKTRLKDTRLRGTAVNHCTLQGVTIADTRIDGCTLGNTNLADSEISVCTLRGVSFHDSNVTNSRIKDSRLEAVGFASLVIEGSELKNVTFRDVFDGRFPRKAEKLSLVNVKLDNVQFIGCTFRDTTIKGFKADNLRIRGRDFSGRTIERLEDLQALSER
ncbi:MAG: pentapeptide repeat-containing protein [Spirochaetia bacterium]